MTSSSSEQLAVLEAAVVEAKRRRDRVTADRNKATGALRGAEAAFADLQERIGAGEQVEPSEEGPLAQALAVAREESSDLRWRARVEGAERAVTEAAGARDAFGREHFAEIAAEEVVKDGPVRDRLQAAHEEMDEAEGEFVARVRRWHELREFGGLLVDDLPGNPLRGDPNEVRARFAEGIESPTPRPLVGER